MWNSILPSTQSGSATGIFGVHWRSTYEERVFVGSDNFIKYQRADGSFWSFASGSGGYQVVAPANVVLTLVTGPTYWTMTFQNGEKRLFDNTSGSLIAILDRNGNTTQLTYDGANRLTTVADPGGRHLTFNYGTGAEYYIVRSITSDFGLSLSYTYDASQRLTQVVKPDSSALNFEYDAQSNVTAVKDTAGVVLESHTYDSQARGTSASRAGGVQALTVTYPQ